MAEQPDRFTPDRLAPDPSIHLMAAQPACAGIVASPENRRTADTCHNEPSYRRPAPRRREKVYHSQPWLSIWLSSVAHVDSAEKVDIKVRAGMRIRVPPTMSAVPHVAA